VLPSTQVLPAPVQLAVLVSHVPLVVFQLYVAARAFPASKTATPNMKIGRLYLILLNRLCLVFFEIDRLGFLIAESGFQIAGADADAVGYELPTLGISTMPLVIKFAGSAFEANRLPRAIARTP
jgi:hypothetical protein